MTAVHHRGSPDGLLDWCDLVAQLRHGAHTELTPELVVGAVTMFEAAHYASQMLTIVLDALMDGLSGQLDSAFKMFTSFLGGLWGRLG